MAKILIVEDDPSISKSVKAWLEKERHTVDVSENGDDGLYLLENYSYDLAILDWQLPGKQGADICLSLRANNNQVPILMLTSRSSLSDRVQGLDSGAYDYMVKPCSLQELSARVRALLRRPSEKNNTVHIFANLELNLESHEAIVDGQKLALSPSEFSILAFLCQHSGASFTAESLLSKLWSGKSNVSKPLIRVHVAHLRQKLVAANCQLKVVSQKGGGYMASLDQSDEPAG